MNRLSIALMLGSLSALSTLSAFSTHASPVKLPSDTENAVKQASQPMLLTNSELTSSELTIATWNTEHLAFPIDNGCRPRSDKELDKLKAYAKSLNADIVALQEVASSDAVKQLFPQSEWNVVMSERPNSESYDCRESGFKSTQQKVAFAVRKGIEIAKSQSLKEFSLDSRGLRHGLELTVNTDFGAMTVLNLHMKSGCFVDNFTRSDKEACITFAKQAPILDAWVEQKEQEKMPYVILGDFNHRLSAPYNHLTRMLTTNSNGSTSSIENVGADLIGCHPYYPAPIDHIWVGNMSSGNVTKSATMHPFADMAPDAMLSDHCALSMTLKSEPLALSSAVKWQTTSKEYGYLTSAIYRQAQDMLIERVLPKGNWAVVMDVDETVLDNSQYQVNIERAGQSYSRASWNAWVMSKQATLVPGAKAFIDTVFELGGKLALVTNRERSLDSYTWDNLAAMGIPVSADNTCLMGRVAEDKSAIDGKTIINDKDLRRAQVIQGTASCFNPESDSRVAFDKLEIFMQVGDNIEDFATVTQEGADIKSLVPKSQSELILLPNPMYGSWSH